MEHRVPQSAPPARPSGTKPSSPALRVDEPPRRPLEHAPRGMLACRVVTADAAGRRRCGSDREVALELTEEFRRRAARDVPMQHLRDLRRLGDDLGDDLHDVQPPAGLRSSTSSCLAALGRSMASGSLRVRHGTAWRSPDSPRRTTKRVKSGTKYPSRRHLLRSAHAASNRDSAGDGRRERSRALVLQRRTRPVGSTEHESPRDGTGRPGASTAAGVAPTR